MVGVERSDVVDAFSVEELVHGTSDRWARSLTPEDQQDLVVEAVERQTGTLTDAVFAVRPGGTVFGFGVSDESFYSLPVELLFRKRAWLTAGYVVERRFAFETAMAYLQIHPALFRTT